MIAKFKNTKKLNGIVCNNNYISFPSSVLYLIKHEK